MDLSAANGLLEFIDVINPSTGKVFATVAAAGAGDIDAAVRAAEACAILIGSLEG